MCKKIITFVVFVFVACIYCSSCNVNNVTTITTSNNGTSQNNQIIETSSMNDKNETDKRDETTSKKDDNIVEEHYTCSFVGPRMERIFETDTRILDLTNVFTYYNKLDGNTYPLCFDPLCDHNSITCTQYLFSDCSAIYSKLDNRIYIGRGDCIFSMNFNASDLKLEYAFSNYGATIDGSLLKPQNERERRLAITFVGCYDNYLYFKRINVPDENVSFGAVYDSSIFRYNITTKNIEDLSKQTGIYNAGTIYIHSKGAIYFMATINNIRGYYCSNLDFENVKMITENIPSGTHTRSIDNGIYYVSREIDEYKNTINFIQFLDFEDDSVRKLTENIKIENGTENGAIYIFYCDDELVFFSIRNPIIVGEGTNVTGTKIYNFNSDHSLYVSTNDGKITKKVYEGLTDKEPNIESYDPVSVQKEGNILKIKVKVFNNPSGEYISNVERKTLEFLIDDDFNLIDLK